MRVLLVADGQVGHARNWIRRLCEREIEVGLVSTFPCATDDLGLSFYRFLPVDPTAKVRAGEKGATEGTAGGRSPLSRLRGTPLWKALAAARNRLAPNRALAQAPALRRILAEFEPDLVHALRIPFEGILAAAALEQDPRPLVISTWGNDFTLFAAENPRIAALTRRSLARANALTSDCRRDVRLARDYGLDPGKPAIVVPGNGGVRTDVFQPPADRKAVKATLALDPDAPLLFNPRGVKAYLRTDSLFEAFAGLRHTHPEARLACASMAGNASIESLAARHGIQSHLILLPPLKHDEMARWFQAADVATSISEHDGTPNSLLEAMACGAFPVAGDIESVREWIEDGGNGLLPPPGDSDAVRRCLERALRDQPLKEEAARRNQIVIAERAEVGAVFGAVVELYDRLAKA